MKICLVFYFSIWSPAAREKVCCTSDKTTGGKLLDRHVMFHPFWSEKLQYCWFSSKKKVKTMPLRASVVLVLQAQHRQSVVCSILCMCQLRFVCGMKFGYLQYSLHVPIKICLWNEIWIIKVRLDEWFFTTFWMLRLRLLSNDDTPAEVTWKVGEIIYVPSMH